MRHRATDATAKAPAPASSSARCPRAPPTSGTRERSYKRYTATPANVTLPVTRHAKQSRLDSAGGGSADKVAGRDTDSVSDFREGESMRCQTEQRRA